MIILDQTYIHLSLSLLNSNYIGQNFVSIEYTSTKFQHSHLDYDLGPLYGRALNIRIISTDLQKK